MLKEPTKKGCPSGYDRIDNDKGYTKDNISPCCFRCNIMKMNISHTDFTKHIKKIHDNIYGKRYRVNRKVEGFPRPY